METTKKPDALCTAILMLKSEAKALRARDTFRDDFTAQRIERILASVEAVEAGLKRAYIQSTNDEQAQFYKSLLFPNSPQSD